MQSSIFCAGRMSVCWANPVRYRIMVSGMPLHCNCSSYNICVCVNRLVVKQKLWRQNRELRQCLLVRLTNAHILLSRRNMLSLRIISVLHCMVWCRPLSSRSAGTNFSTMPKRPTQFSRDSLIWPASHCRRARVYWSAVTWCDVSGNISAIGQAAQVQIMNEMTPHNLVRMKWN